ncbi:dioxygenase family protein [Sphingomonas soli]|uniref:dioxygenase family protein n=1 Tax=Sphingomonas soli TaxID=266127 RepID=UPI00083294C9|nr:intradiol ring-cleavage dioxygenase [Sphingomonas soli]
MYDHDEDHDLGLAHDLKAMAALASRRRALRWFAGAGATAMVAACDSGGSSGSGTVTTSGTTATPTPTPSTTAAATPTPSPTAAGTCVADPTETAGPYPGDGTNTSQGSTSNVLTASNVVRSDIRPSFIGSTTVAQGVQVVLTLTVVNVNAACAPLAGYAVYLWHCDRAGNYSLYGSAAAESYLRGVGVTDANGQVSFTTIFPGCYDGRWPHMHFEVFSSLANATGGRFAVLTSQLAMPAATASTVYNGATGYSASITNFARVSLNSDGIFGDNTAAQNTAMTPVLTGSVAAGYTALATIGIAR